MDAGASVSVKRFIPQPARLNVGGTAIRRNKGFVDRLGFV